MTDSNSLICNSENSTLLLVDIQDKLISIMPGKVMDRLKKNTILLLNAASLLSIPVIATRQYPKGLGPIDKEITEMLDENTLRYDKTCFSCAGVDNLIEDLKKNGRSQIIVTGIEAHICVIQTALDLLVEGFQVFVVIDAVASRQRENYENAIARLQQAGVVCINSESVVFEWLKDASHQAFKTLSAMVR